MPRLPWFLIAGILLAGVASASATSLKGGATQITPPQDILWQAQYRGSLCGNWQRECARLYGSGTDGWQQCMNQPGAIYDCGGGGHQGPSYSQYRQRGGDLCGNWHRECARLHGHRTYNWQQCMNQPAAVWDCGGGGYQGPSYGRQLGGDLCGNWHRECARLHGYRTHNWQQCMNQPAALWDCERGR